MPRKVQRPLRKSESPASKVNRPLPCKIATGLCQASPSSDLPKVGIRALPIMKEFNQELLNKFSDSEIKIIHCFVDTIIENYR